MQLKRVANNNVDAPLYAKASCTILIPKQCGITCWMRLILALNLSFPPPPPPPL